MDIRRLVDEVGFTPRFDAAEAVHDYVKTQGGRRLVPSARQAVAR
jgi:hypothetical protein